MTRTALVAGLATLGLFGCALPTAPEALGPPAKETIVAVDASQ